MGCDCSENMYCIVPSDFNPRTPCGVRPGRLRRWQCLRRISIHAPRVGCDHFRPGNRRGNNPFQSTHPVWGATRNVRNTLPRLSNFNPRTPCGVRRGEYKQEMYVALISIHAPRVGCDMASGQSRSSSSNFNPRTPCGVRHGVHFNRSLDLELFQSTHPVWGATTTSGLARSFLIISIHAPRVGCDQSQVGGRGRMGDFNPRTPCGVRRPVFYRHNSGWKFQSTHPVWGATPGSPGGFPAPGISIHAPRVGCDVTAFVLWHLDRFQSTHPVWGATGCIGPFLCPERFQSTHPVWGATWRAASFGRRTGNFNPRTPCGVRQGVECGIICKI